MISQNYKKAALIALIGALTTSNVQAGWFDWIPSWLNPSYIIELIKSHPKTVTAVELVKSHPKATAAIVGSIGALGALWANRKLQTHLLFDAIDKQSVWQVRLHLMLGANPNGRNSHGQSPFQLIKSNERSSIQIAKSLEFFGAKGHHPKSIKYMEDPDLLVADLIKAKEDGFVKVVTQLTQTDNKNKEQSEESYQWAKLTYTERPFLTLESIESNADLQNAVAQLKRLASQNGENLIGYYEKRQETT